MIGTPEERHARRQAQRAAAANSNANYTAFKTVGPVTRAAFLHLRKRLHASTDDTLSMLIKVAERHGI